MKGERQGAVADWRSLSALAGVVGLFFAPWVWAGKIFYWADYTLAFYPWRHFARQTFQQGVLPLWNPLSFGGMPFIGNLQSAVFYPFNLLLLPLEPPQGFMLSAALHLLLGGCLQYGYLRSLREADSARCLLTPFASLIGALCFMLGGFAVCRLQYPTMLNVWAWTPLLCWLAERLRGDARWQTALALSLVVGVQFLAGHLQMSAMSVGLVVALAACGVRGAPFAARGETAPASCFARRAVRRWALLALALLLGVGLAALQLLPTAETARLSIRSHIDLKFASRYSLPPWQMLMFLLPDSFGRPADSNYWGDPHYLELCAYFGLLPLLLALAALRCSPYRHRWLFAGIGAAGLLLAFGEHTPLHHFVHRLPAFGWFKGPGRFLFLVAFSGSGLAALGAEALLMQRHEVALNATRRLLTGAAVAAGALLVVVVAGGEWLISGLEGWLRWQLPRIQVKMVSGTYHTVAEHLHRTITYDLVRALLMLIAPLIALALLRGAERRWRALRLVFLAVVVGDLLTFGWQTAPLTESDALAYTPRAVSRLRRDDTPARILPRPDVNIYAWSDRYVSFSSFGEARPAHLRGWLDTLTSNLHLTYGVDSVEVYDPLRPARFAALLGHAQDRLTANPNDTTLLDMLNVKYLLTMDKLPPGSKAWRLVENGSPHLYQSRWVLPRAWLARSVWRAHSVEEARHLMDTAAFDPRQTAAVEGAKNGLPPSSQSPQHLQSSPVRVARPTANAVTLYPDAPSESLLVLSEAWWAGWRADLNGRAAQVWRANAVLRGVITPAGKQRVRMGYCPQTFVVGGYLSLLTLAALAGGWARAKAR